MRSNVVKFSFLLAFSASVFAAPPSDAQLNELMAITNAKEMTNNTNEQVDQMMNSMIQEKFKNQQINQAQQKVINGMKGKMSYLLKSKLAWEDIAPNLTKIYKASFSQQEVDGMIKFYKTPTGQAVINKMPLVMQNTMLYIQTIMQDIMPEIVRIQQEFDNELNAIEQN